MVRRPCGLWQLCITLRASYKLLEPNLFFLTRSMACKLEPCDNLEASNTVGAPTLGQASILPAHMQLGVPFLAQSGRFTSSVSCQH